MVPRRLDEGWLRTSAPLRGSVSPPAARVRRSTHRHRVTRWLLVLLCVFPALVGLVAAENDSEPATSTSHFNGLRVISGAGFRAFANRFERQLRGRRCLSFHEAGNWWRYEWCVGHDLRQFHEDPFWTISLGRFSPSASKSLRILPADDLDALRNPDLMGYRASQRYANGDSCPQFGRSRQTTIEYKCCVFRANETYIESVDEPAPCDYVLRVCTPAACGLMQKDQYVFGVSPHVSDEERLVLAATVKDMFYHAYNGYMDHAFPLDALLPLSCRGETFELGKIQMLTLIDTLDTLAILEDAAEFQRAVQLVVARADFDLDTEVSVFETTIRVLGGLLSAHLFAVEPTLRLFPPGKYKNELLALAVDLADRLLPAFNTTTRIPYGTVNLRFGVPKGETPIASTAGAGSLSMEFTMLSVLTGDAKYANASRQAVRALFERRSRVGLLGKHIDTKTGEWTETSSGPGSNSDSFYEYLWKMYATFNDREMLDMFERVYKPVVECNLHGDWFADVSMWSGCAHGSAVVFENLVAFWPGMQATLGHLHAATRSMNTFYRVWREYGFVPEQFDVLRWKPVRGGGARYPLRPELIESTFYMHEATNDSSWLRAGAHFVHSLQKHTKTKCGYATVKDIETKQLEDNMPSFFLSETCKYLYLLFNTSHFLRNGSYVFTTEAHPFPVLPAKRVEPVVLPTNRSVAESEVPTRRSSRRLQCPRPVFWHALGYQLDYEGSVVDRTERCAKPTSPKPVGPAPVAAEPMITGKLPNVDDWLPIFEKQLRDQLSKLGGKAGNNDGEFLQHALSHDDLVGKKSLSSEELLARLTEKAAKHRKPEDDEPGRVFTQHLHGGPRLGHFQMDQVDSLIRFTRQETGEWIETTGMEDRRFTVLSWLPERRGFSDEPTGDEDDELPLLLPLHRVYEFPHGRQHPALRRHCKLTVDVSPPDDENPYASSSATKSFSFSCAGSSFGVKPLDAGTLTSPIAAIALAEPLDACVPLAKPEALKGKLVVVRRGACFFETKVRNAAVAGAMGVVIVNDEDHDRVMVMSGSTGSVDDDVDELEASDDHKQSVAIPAVMVPRRAGEWLSRQLVKGHVSGHIELSMQDRVSDLTAIHAYLDAAEASDKAEDDDTLRQKKHELARRAYPRMEIARGQLGRVQVFAPEWTLDMTPVHKPDSEELANWLLEIIETPQSKASASDLSP